MKIKYGGEIKKGDFIAISHRNYVEFGWFIGNGQGNSVQYFSYRVPQHYFEAYKSDRLHISKSDKKHIEKYGLTTKILYKSFIWGDNDDRIVKITNPEEIFQGEDLSTYLESKQSLIELKFLNK